MKLVRFLPWSIVFIGLILAIAWHFRTEIVSSILDRVVKTMEIQDLDYQLESVGTSSALFSHLTFEISSQQARYRISSEHLEVAFTVDTLGSGRVDSVHISNLAIREERGRENRGPLNSDAWLLMLVSVLDHSLPFQSIAVDELHLSSGAFNPTRSWPMRLNAYSTPAGMSVELHHHQHTLGIKTAGNTLDLSLADMASQPILELILTLEHSEAGELKGIFGNLDLRTGPVLDWWKTFVSTDDAAIKGGVAGQFHVEPGDGGWRLRLNGTAEHLAWEDSVIRNGAIILDAEIPGMLDFEDLVVRFYTGSRLTVETMESGPFTLADMALVFNGDLAVKKNAVEYVAGSDNSFTSSRLDWKDNHFSKLHISPVLGLRYDPDGWVVNIREGFVTARESRFGNYHLTGGKAQLQSPMRIAMARDAPRQGWAIDRGRIAIPDFSLTGDNLGVHGEDLTLEVEDLAPGHYQFNISAMNVGARKNSAGLGLESLNARVELHDHELDTHGSFALARFPGRYEFQLDADLQGNTGNYAVRQTDPVDMLEDAAEVNFLLSGWVPDLYVTGGAVSLAANGQWKNNEAVFNRVDVNARDVSGGYSGVLFTGLDVQGPLYFPPVPQSESAVVEVETIAYGVVAENIVSDVRLSAFGTGTRPGVRINRLQGEVLGSRFVSENFSFDPGSSVNRLNISLSGLDIEELVKLHEIKGLEARGKIDGQLPVEISGGGVQIRKGKIWNQQEGGTIRYWMEPDQAESMSGLLTDPVIRALEDFNYDVLTGLVEYEADGNLLVRLHIEGTSPNIADSQPVHLNINTEQNVLLLLKSLGYADRLGDQLDERILDQVNTRLNPDQAN